MTVAASRLSSLDVRALKQPPRLIMNPHAGQKLGMSTNASDADAVLAALRAVGIEARLYPTERPKHATELAREAVNDGCKLVIAAGGDGTVSEAAAGLTGTDTVLGIMPLGSIMNMARTLCIPRDVAQAAEVITAGAGPDDGRRARIEPVVLGSGRRRPGRGTVRLLRTPRQWPRAHQGCHARAVAVPDQPGPPAIDPEHDGQRVETHAGMVTIANGPFVGAAYALAPEAVVDDALLDVVVFRGASVPRMLVHMVLVAGGRRAAPAT